MKKLIILMAVLYLAASGYSFYGRMSHTNRLREEGDSAFSVAALGNYADEAFFQDYKKSLEDSPLIFRVRATGVRVYEAKSIGQRAIVEQVFQGNEDLVGEDILLVANYQLFYLEQDDGEIMYGANTGFVNYMQEGHEYLVFIQEQLEAPGIGAVYKSDSRIVTPIFDYAQRENAVANAVGEYASVSYDQVADSEFFAGSQEILDRLQDLKTEMIEKYH